MHELLVRLGAYYSGYATESHPRPWNADELMAAVGLTEHAGQKVRVLSAGSAADWMFAIGIVGRPELLFLDEPTTGFDPEARHEFHDLIRRLADTERTTIVITTHDLDEAAKVADRIFILNSGRIVADGTPDTLAQRIAGKDEVRWVHHGQHLVRSTSESTKLAFDLFRQYGEAITDLEIRRPSLEDTYLALVRHAEVTQPTAPVRTEVGR